MPFVKCSTSFMSKQKEKEIVTTPTKKKELHPALRANADRLKRGEALHKKEPVAPTRPKIRSKQKKG